MAAQKKHGSEWNMQPDSSDRRNRYQIMRTPPNGIRNLIILSHSPLGRYTHRWKGRTVPCREIDCRACEQEIDRRWYGWLFVKIKKTDQIVCFEYTSAASEAVMQYFNRYRTLRGARLDAWRKNDKANGELGMSIFPPKEHAEAVPVAPSREKFLSVLWDVSIKLTEAAEPPESERSLIERNSLNTPVDQKRNGRKVD